MVAICCQLLRIKQHKGLDFYVILLFFIFAYFFGYFVKLFATDTAAIVYSCRMVYKIL